MKRTIGRMILVAVLLAGAAPAAAQDSRYESWAEPGGDAQDLVAALRALIAEAERVRAADPRFLADLKALADRFDLAAPAAPGIVLSDDFRDGDFQRGTAWTVRRGQYWVEDAVGLRTMVEAQAAPAQAQPQQPQRGGGDDLAAALLENLLGDVLAPKDRRSDPAPSAGTTTQTAVAEPAEITAVAAIPGAFKARLEITSRVLPGGAPAGGELRFGPFQGRSDGPGYQLAYAPGAGLRLLRLSRGQAALIGSYDRAVNLEDGRLHVVELARAGDGTITASVDGTALISAADRSFRDPFDGFAIINRGGDYAVRSIEVSGAY
ncbi:MAG: hypothetical protein QF926_14775 [Alphaproteobacteria bacterium]|jgi:hypothetical protein|nr:hypothetical protein [Alphaproteobacteria bacterium]